MTPAMRFAKKELRALGCEIVKKESHRLVFRLLDGSEYVVTSRTTDDRVRDILARQATIAGELVNDVFTDYRAAVNPPRLTTRNFKLSEHFTGRMALMIEQTAGEITVTEDEVRAAIHRPLRVRESRGGRYAFCGKRVAVIVDLDPDDGRYVAVTLMWTRQQFFDMYPRPEKRRRNSDRYRNQPPGTYRD